MKKRLIGIIILAALVILSGTFWWLVKSGRISPFAAQVPTISLYPSGIYNVGTTFGVNIMADSASQQITGVDIHKLHFDPSKLQVEGQVQTGGMFAVYSTPEVDTGAGTIALSGFIAPGTEQIAISGVFASLTFRVLAAGNSQLSFDFTAGNTTDTNITKYDTGTGTVSDILEQATSGNYTLEQPTPAPSPTSGGGDGGRGTATPTPEVTATPTPGEPTPTAEEITGPGIEETPPSGTPAPAEIAQGPTPSPGAVTSPSPQVTKSPTSPSPKASPKPSTKLAGFAISPAVGILLYIGIPVLITLIIFYIWWRRRKKTSQPTPEKEEDFDDDEII